MYLCTYVIYLYYIYILIIDVSMTIYYPSVCLFVYLSFCLSIFLSPSLYVRWIFTFFLQNEKIKVFHFHD